MINSIITAALPFFNSSYGTGVEGVVNYANIISNYWMVPFFLIFIFIAVVTVFNKDRQYSYSGIVAFALAFVLIAAMLFKLATDVSEATIYIIVIAMAGAAAWGLWQSR